MPTFRGVVKKNPLEGGFWELIADDGAHYQLTGGGPTLQKEGMRVEIQGKVDRQSMGIGMTGPVLAVKSFKPI